MVRDNRRRDIEGALHIPLVLALFIITFAGLGIWGYLRHWKFTVETQFRLNQCVGSVAQDFQNKLNSILRSNLEIKGLRAIILILPPDKALPLKAVLGALVLKQNVLLTTWKAKRVQWTISQGCGKWGDRALPLPSFDFERAIPDMIGPKPLTWPGIMPSEFHFEASHSPRTAAARVEEGNINDQLESHFGTWTATWCPPSSFRSKAF